MVKKFIKCKVTKCDKNSHYTNWGKRGFCPRHYRLFMRNGKPELIRAPNGQGYISRGYKIIYKENRRIPEHRYIMEKFLKRKLLPFPNEIVHHINGNKIDNRIENLYVMSQSEHISKRHYKLYRTHSKKECSQCHKIFPMKRFCRQNDRTNGRSQCIYCLNQYSKNRRHTMANA